MIGLLVVGLVGGCIGSDTTVCEWGEVCASGKVCHGLSQLCVFPEQIPPCEGQPDGTLCAFSGGDGACLNGVCLDTPFCGNGDIDPEEGCDGSNLGGLTCQDLGYTSGTLGCTEGCALDEGGCTSQCGNGVRESDEVCDGFELGGTTCQIESGLGNGELVCSADCSALITTGCHYCGNGAPEGPEVCDGTALGGVTCDSLGYPGGGTPTCVDCLSVNPSSCCQDGDGDGFGANCTLGEDCDDSLPGITGPCQANGCPQGWAHVPAGDFWMGCNSGELDGTCGTAYPNESPRHAVTLTEYCLELTEVSVGAYRACVDSGTCQGGLGPRATSESEFCNWSASAGSREQHPVNCIDWSDSRQYCQLWLGGDLPTEAQWEKGARGTDQRKYPWDNAPEPDCTRANGSYGGDCNSTTPPGTWEVGHLTSTGGDSPYGLKDMAGNVWEWVQDWYEIGYYSLCSSGCTDPLNTNPVSGLRLIRGGGYGYTAVYQRTVARLSYDPANRSWNAGFRCRRTP